MGSDDIKNGYVNKGEENSKDTGTISSGYFDSTDKLSEFDNNSSSNALGSGEETSGNVDESLDNDLSSDILEFESIGHRPRGRLIPRVKGLMIVVLFVAGGYLAWAEWGNEILKIDRGGLPIVRTPKDPIKVRPKDPGGIEIPNQDKLVYDRLERTTPRERTENLLPRPEKPMIQTKKK